MVDAALIETCSDPSLTPAIVEQFVAAAGSDDPLAITVRAGGRLILVPKPISRAEAFDIIRQYVGKASVRVGITQLPAEGGVMDTNEFNARLFDPCENLKLGTALFAKVARIVTRWYGSPTSPEVMPQLFEDAVYAWKTGLFEGEKVFQAADPGGAGFPNGGKVPAGPLQDAASEFEEVEQKGSVSKTPNDGGEAGIRVDLSRLGQQQ